jgi:hypothetical protein
LEDPQAPKFTAHFPDGEPRRIPRFHQVRLGIWEDDDAIAVCRGQYGQA